MADSEDRASGGKRERLVSGAAALIHRQGVQASTLAEIAEEADVPVGNVYYYFKTRDELVGAVVESWEQSFRRLLDSLEAEPDPAVRLKAFAGSWDEQRGAIAAHGCPIGSLNLELTKGAGGPRAERLFALMRDWAARQFRALGVPDPSHRATELLAGIQGAALLTDAFSDPKLMRREVRRLQRWIDEVASLS